MSGETTLESYNLKHTEMEEGDFTPGSVEYNEQQRKQKRKQNREELNRRLRTFWRGFKDVILSIVLPGILVCALLGGMGYFFFWMYEDSHRESKEFIRNATVQRSEIICIPSYYENGKEYPAKTVNYLEVVMTTDSTVMRINPNTLPEDVNVGDTVIVSTFTSPKLKLKSKIVRFRWEGELYE